MHEAALAPIENVCQLGGGNDVPASLMGQSKVEDVVMGESAETFGSPHMDASDSLGSNGHPAAHTYPPAQPNSRPSPSIQPDFGPSISTALRVVCFKSIYSKQVIFISHSLLKVSHSVNRVPEWSGTCMPTRIAVPFTFGQLQRTE